MNFQDIGPQGWNDFILHFIMIWKRPLIGPFDWDLEYELEYVMKKNFLLWIGVWNAVWNGDFSFLEYDWSINRIKIGKFASPGALPSTCHAFRILLLRSVLYIERGENFPSLNYHEMEYEREYEMEIFLFWISIKRSVKMSQPQGQVI